MSGFRKILVRAGFFCRCVVDKIVVDCCIFRLRCAVELRI